MKEIFVDDQDHRLVVRGKEIVVEFRSKNKADELVVSKSGVLTAEEQIVAETYASVDLYAQQMALYAKQGFEWLLSKKFQELVGQTPSDTPKKHRGRQPGSKNKRTLEAEAKAAKSAARSKHKGRKPGSKNKKKVAA